MGNDYVYFLDTEGDAIITSRHPDKVLVGVRWWLVVMIVRLSGGSLH
jgi:hypothetical protein